MVLSRERSENRHWITSMQTVLRYIMHGLLFGQLGLLYRQEFFPAQCILFLKHFVQTASVLRGTGKPYYKRCFFVVLTVQACFPSSLELVIFSTGLRNLWVWKTARQEHGWARPVVLTLVCKVVQGSSLSCPGADAWTVYLPMLDSWWDGAHALHSFIATALHY